MGDAPRLPPPSVSTPLRLRILHLEDSSYDRELIQGRLQADGVHAAVTPAGTGEEFEAALRREQFDIVLSDYSLPGYDGFLALDTALRLQPEAPFIFVSGTIGGDSAIESLKRGATDYVLKDRLERLGMAIHRALQERDERRRREQAEHALRESEARFREMAENIREVFWSMTADHRRVLYLSAAFEEIWGRKIADVQARPASWFEAIWPTDQERFAAALDRLAQGTPFQIEYRITQPDGSVRWIEDRGYPVSGAAGAVERLVGVAVDITPRKALEAQLQQAQKMEAIGQLAGGIAHDFNNVLTVVTGYSRLLLDGDALSPALIEPMTQIYTAGTRAANLTRQLLVFSRQQAVNRQPIDLNEIVEDISAMLCRLIGERVGLRLEPAAASLLVEADAGMMEQVLMNLAVNARDAMPDGGTLVIGTERVQLDAAAAARQREARPGEFACVSVRDTGCGIKPENLTRIFEPFYTTKDPGRGTGLGLATVFGIVRQHEGWIEVESTPGQGSCFRVLLPITHRSPLLLGGRPVRSLGGALGSETILLVEDETNVREFAIAVLRGSGFRVLQAANGLEALEVWKWHGSRIALLFTDLVIPQFTSGVALAQQLRREKPSLKIVLTSGYPMDHRNDLSTPEGMRFVQKPYKPHVLTQTVRDALDDTSE